jgi:hypothetical protein
MGSFYIWMEEKLARRRLQSSLIRALGLTKTALARNINLDEIPEDNLQRAIQSLGISDDAKEKLTNFVKNNRHHSLMQMLDLIDDAEIEQQDTSTSTPAVLPQSNQPIPKPKPDLQQQQPNFGQPPA